MWWIAIALAGPLSDDLPGDAGADPRPVVGGVPSVAGDWPYAAAMQSNGTFTCSGVLIAPDLVLTAGHCGWNLTEVRLDTVDHSGEAGELVPVAEVWVHEDFYQTFDVALVRLETAASVAPPRLGLSCMAGVLLQDGGEAVVVGFGATDLEGEDLGTTLNEATVDIEDADCDDPLRGCNEAVMPAGEVRAGGGGVDSCVGDSGGPLLVRDTDGLPWLVGITSRSAVPSETSCGDGGIYVRVDAVQEWLESVSGRSLDMPDCDGVNRAPEPLPLALEVGLGEQLSVVLEPNDPDAGDRHSFVLDEEPTYVTATVDAGGRLVVVAPDDLIGPDRLTVRIVDDGEPPLAASAIVDITIVEDETPEACGCASGSPGQLPWWGLLVLLWRRR